MAVKAGVYGGRTQQERRDDRGRRLLEATLTTWGSGEGRAVTMTRICAEAGLTERYFYEHFSNLDAALTATLESIADEIAREAITALEVADGGAKDKVRAGLTAFVRILTDDPRKGRVAMIESVAAPALRSRRTELLRGFVGLTATESRLLHGQQAWDEPEAALAATMFIGGLAQLVTDWLEGAFVATPEDIVDAAVRLHEATAHR